MRFVCLTISMIAIAASILPGCKKDENKNTTSTAANEFFVTGKGLKKIHEVNHKSQGFQSGFKTANMMLSTGGTMDWVFAWYSAIGTSTSYEVYRRRINVATGDTLANPGVPGNLPKEWAVSPDYYHYALWSNDLYWPTSNSVEGEPAGLPFPAAVQWKVYNNGQVFSYNATSGYGGVGKPISIAYRRNGAVVDTNYQIRHDIGPSMIRCMDMDMNMAGEVLMFFVTGDSIQVRRFRDYSLVAGIPCSALSRSYTSTITPLCNMETRRSADGTKIMGWVKDVNLGLRYNTTFVFNLTTNSIQQKLIAAKTDEGASVNNFAVADDDGNVYFREEKTIASEYSGRIMKQTPAGTSVFAEDFIKGTAANIQYMKAIGSKLYVVLMQGENTNAPAGSRETTCILTVAE